MFLNSREEFDDYLTKNKKPFMATFYKSSRKKFNVLINQDGKPVGNKWSFDEDNRKKIPKNISVPKFPKILETKHTKTLKPIIEKIFKNHPGDTKNFWFATEFNDVVKLFNFFTKEKLNLFGDYEDAVNQEKEWADFLFKDGSMIGLSVPLLSNYIEYIANKRLRMIGLKPIYDISSANNPLPWTRHWFNSRGLQNAPQETEIESYVIGGIKQDVTDDTFTDFKL